VTCVGMVRPLFCASIDHPSSCARCRLLGASVRLGVTGWPATRESPAVEPILAVICMPGTCTVVKVAGVRQPTVAEPCTARQAALSIGASLAESRIATGFWPLDPGFGSADGRSGRPGADR
jgi:hypothetical protein